MKDEISLKELLECEFTIDEEGNMVGLIPLNKINMISDILINLQEENQKLKKRLYEMTTKFN